MSSLVQSTESYSSIRTSALVSPSGFHAEQSHGTDGKFVSSEDETWPFLLRFPVSSFGMCLGVNSQAILWKTLAIVPSMKFLHAVRIKLFRGIQVLSLAWWAYTFPLTGAPIATIWYSNEVENVLTRTLSVALSSISTFALTAVFVSTFIHGFVLHDLFPNDIPIGRTDHMKRSKSSKKLSQLKSLMFSL
ncbi:hypothetical protein J5N97_000281 [Dioscorea zingiberensis]|uniref:Uncharacterized protein n=1 Tax=Dioscorea zingiberensis TaxID=325984 RepID=A0A9D5H1N8_9LILI|nr:hypothetical protein J5N97_000281 [Dioscorea zingiberensis]